MVLQPWKTATDIGCGSGQSTLVLSPYFENVIGLDVSDAQIECAKITHSSSNIQYKVSNCDKLPFPSSSIQLVTLCQAVHWFNTKELFEEVHRILVHNGVIAIYCYWIPIPKTENKEKDSKISSLIMQDLHEEYLGKYWDKERCIVQNHYADIPFPFKDVQRENLIRKHDSSLMDYMGYLRTWSAYQKLCRTDYQKAKQILEDVHKQLRAILGEDKKSEDIIFTLHTDYFMLMGCH